MAISSNTPFAGLDFGQFSQWQAIRDPSGQAYYVLPGNPGYVYDPFSSAAAGRPVIYRNPMAAVAEREKAIQAEEKARKDELEAQSPINQAIPAVLGTAGTLGGMYLAKDLFAPAAKEAAKEVATQTLGEAAADAAMGGGSAMGEAMGGGVVDAAAAEATPGLFPGVLANAGSMGALPLAAIAAGTYLGGNAAYDMFKGRKPDLPGRVVLGMATGGLSEVPGLLGFGSQKSTKDIEGNRWEAIGKQDLYNTKEGYDFGSTNPEFAETRDERFLKASDIYNKTPDIWANNPYWDTWNQDKQMQYLNTLLGQGKVTEKKGGIYFDDDYAKQLAEQMQAGTFVEPEKKKKDDEMSAVEMFQKAYMGR